MLSVRTSEAANNKADCQKRLRMRRRSDLMRIRLTACRTPGSPDDHSSVSRCVTRSPRGRITFSRLGDDDMHEEHLVACKAKRRTSLNAENLAMLRPSSGDFLAKRIGDLGMVMNSEAKDVFTQRLTSYVPVRCLQPLNVRLFRLQERAKRRCEKVRPTPSNDAIRAKITTFRNLVHSIFQSRASTMAEGLTRREVRHFLMQLKCWPENPAEKQVYDGVIGTLAPVARRVSFKLSEHDEESLYLTFDGFMALVISLKNKFAESRRSQAKVLFNDYCSPERMVNEEALLRIAEVAYVISSKSQYLQTDEASKKLQKSIHDLITEFADGSAEFGFDAFYKIYVELALTVASLRLSKSSELMRRFPIPDTLGANYRATLCDLKCLFDQCDGDHSQSLSKGEIICMASELGVAFTTYAERVQIELMFRLADTDGSDELDFVEFLGFMTCFAEERKRRKKNVEYNATDQCTSQDRRDEF